MWANIEPSARNMIPASAIFPGTDKMCDSLTHVIYAKLILFMYRVECRIGSGNWTDEEPERHKVCVRGALHLIPG